MSQGRPIGKQIRVLCAALERYGACDGARLARVTDIPRACITKAMTRASDYGMVSVNRRNHPYVFEAAINWRELADAPRQSRRPAARRMPPNSVFQLANYYAL